MDEEIIRLIKKRKEKGIELLIDIYSPLIITIVKKHLYNLEQYHDECINDVYMGIWNNIHNFDKGKNSFKNWVAAITNYKTIDYKRKYLKNMLDVDISEVAIASNYNLEIEVLREEICEEVEELLKPLSVKNRDLFIRLFVQQDSVEEVSRELNIKPSVLYNRVYRAKNKLRKLVKIK